LILRFLNTIRHLEPIQVRNRIERKFKRPELWTGDAPALRPAAQPWETVATVRQSLLDESTVRFLNETGPARDWQNHDKSYLWIYNLHYFDDLHAEGAATRTDMHRDWIAHWIKHNPPMSAPGWEPYPSSLRIVNWLQWILAGNDPVPGMVQSIVEQTHALSQQLEYHLLANHLLANAKALVFSGCCFEGDEAQGWLRTGLELLEQQYAEQILADGAHFELSPMYHSILLVDLLDTLQLARCFPDSALNDLLPTLQENGQAMADWLQGVLHPDGEIPFFNDAAFGIAPTPAAIFDYASKLDVQYFVPEEGIQFHGESGYIAFRQHDQVALLDVAEAGADCNPGHAHADTLSFEWSLFGQRVLVNSGTGEYGQSEERDRQRGTAAHNTVEVNEEDSSDVWDGFKLGQRARPFDVSVETEGEVTIARASHTGYKHLLGGVVHTREWRVQAGELVVQDTLDGKCHFAWAYFHFHPAIEFILSGSTLNMTLPGGQQVQVTIEGGRPSLDVGSWHPEFGLRENNHTLAIEFTAPKVVTTFRY
jgi:uncharacterized heparinase superfamily protein